MDANPADDPRGNFESLWQTVNEKYTFFELKNIDWDSVYTHYSPMVQNDISEMELFGILDSMLYDLRDGHVNLVAPFNLSRNWNWYLEFPDNFDEDVIERFYLGDDYKIAGGLQYTIIDSIGYIYYGSFSSGFTQNNLDAVFEFMKGTKGLIVDVRHNGGGALGNAFALARRLAQTEREAMVTFEKTGPGHDDFDNGLGYSIGPSDGVNYDGEVIILTNRRCYSATNTFAGLLFGFDNVRQVGDWTGGGGGIPVDNELPNGWRYRFSATTSLIPIGDTAFFNIEQGVPPDINVEVTETQLASGFDAILETGLSLLE